MSHSHQNFSGNIITSRSNKTIRHLYKLMRDSKYRRKSGEFIAEGARLCEDAARSGAGIVAAFFTEKAFSNYKTRLDKILESAGEVYMISQDVADYISDTKSPQGVFCVCVIPKTLDITGSCDKINTSSFLIGEDYSGGLGGIIALENIQDPANLGTILRTAEALGIPKVWLSSDCCDLYNPKVVRGSMGAVFRISILILNDFPAQLLALKNEGISVYACVAEDAEPITKLSAAKDHFVCVIGNEGAGLTSATTAACSHRVTIPMRGDAESLNAAIAAGIVMWEMVRER